MRIKPLIALVLAALFFLCTYDQEAKVDQWPVSAEKEIGELDIVQRTCALEVVVSLIAYGDVGAFGTDLNDTMKGWEMDPSETMITCTPPPTSTEDTSRVGVLIQEPHVMEVAISPKDLEGPAALDRKVNDTMIMEGWSADPAGTMLACAGPPASTEDTTGVDVNGPY